MVASPKDAIPFFYRCHAAEFALRRVHKCVGVRFGRAERTAASASSDPHQWRNLWSEFQGLTCIILVEEYQWRTCDAQV